MFFKPLKLIQNILINILILKFQFTLKIIKKVHNFNKSSNYLQLNEKLLKRIKNFIDI